MATKSKDAEIAVLQTQMSNVEQKVDKLDTKIDSVIFKIDAVAVVKTEIDGLKEEIAELRRKTFRNSWLFPTLSAGASSILTLLIVSFLTQASK